MIPIQVIELIIIITYFTNLYHARCRDYYMWPVVDVDVDVDVDGIH